MLVSSGQGWVASTSVGLEAWLWSWYCDFEVVGMQEDSVPESSFARLIGAASIEWHKCARHGLPGVAVWGVPSKANLSVLLWRGTHGVYFCD